MKVIKSVKMAFAGVLMAFMANGAIAGEAPPPESIDGTTRVSAVQVVELVEKLGDKLIIVDSRKKEDRQAAGWIPGSIGLPDYETTPETLAKIVPSKDTDVLFYCNGTKCGRSVKTATMAVQEGYKKVHWFRGGWEEWAKEGLPVEK
jgi:rhodanese-related sulfurtransferase